MGNGKFKENSVTWYSRECFIYRIINTCMRRMNYTEIFHIRYLIFHLPKKFKELWTRDPKKTLSRNYVPKEEIDRMKNIIGQPFQFNGFISTSGDVKIGS